MSIMSKKNIYNDKVQIIFSREVLNYKASKKTCKILCKIIEREMHREREMEMIGFGWRNYCHKEIGRLNKMLHMTGKSYPKIHTYTCFSTKCILLKIDKIFVWTFQGWRVDRSLRLSSPP